MSDQDKISPCNIDTISSRQVLRIKKNINHRIISWSKTKFSKPNTIRMVWQTVRRITNKEVIQGGFMCDSCVICVQIFANVPLTFSNSPLPLEHHIKSWVRNTGIDWIKINIKIVYQSQFEDSKDITFFNILIF